MLFGEAEFGGASIFFFLPGGKLLLKGMIDQVDDFGHEASGVSHLVVVFTDRDLVFEHNVWLVNVKHLKMVCQCFSADVESTLTERTLSLDLE